MGKGLPLLAAAVVVAFLPECTRLELLAAAIGAYYATSVLVDFYGAQVKRIFEKRRQINSIRWTRRHKAVTVDLKAKPEWPVLVDEPDYLLVQWIGGIDNENNPC